MQTETGKLVRWIDDKGFGFIKPATGDNDIFIHISALKGMSRPPVIGDTVLYQTEFDASGKLRAIYASIEGVAKQLTLEPVARKRELPTGSASYERAQQKPKQRINQPQKRLSSLPLLFLLLIIGGVFAYDKLAHRPTEIVDQPTTQPVVESVIPEQHFQCQGKVYCSQMTSREEAEFYLDNCPGTKMDGDMDGVPCENQF
ncbi:cold shock domain-containing protein [Methylomicrobium lacus]|uniref:cold shock domain-containing protein n=1 Tax=Methylomicrobium lacus TaxID=136992 RepID=UPI00045EB906|nr:cold shock domain-containing protein [Methylomicrobium lacus]